MRSTVDGGQVVGLDLYCRPCELGKRSPNEWTRWSDPEVNLRWSDRITGQSTLELEFLSHPRLDCIGDFAVPAL